MSRSPSLSSASSLHERESKLHPIFDALNDSSERGITNLRDLLQEHPEAVHARNQWQETPLHVAAVRGGESQLRLLLECSADPLAHANGGRSAFRYAAVSYQERYFPLLIRALIAEAEDTVLNYRDFNALCLEAVGRNDLRTLLSIPGNILLDAETSNTAFADAATSCLVESMYWLLQRGMDVDLEIEGRTPLMHALFCEDLAMVRFLIQRGAEIYFPGRRVVESISSAVDPNFARSITEEEDFRSNLADRISRDEISVEELEECLKERPYLSKVRVNMNGDTLLHCAATRPALWDMLIAHGANSHEANFFGEEALTLQIRYSNISQHLLPPLAALCAEYAKASADSAANAVFKPRSSWVGSTSSQSDKPEKKQGCCIMM